MPFGLLKFLFICFCLLVAEQPCSASQGFSQYTDPEKRFIFDYPSTMKLTSSNPDEVILSHPQASLRIAVFIQPRHKKGSGNAEAFLEALKKNLQDEMKEVKFLEEGKSPNIKGTQGYLICSFKNQKGTQLVQLVQFYLGEDKVLQMTISDKPAGFKNLLEVIRKIHHSLRVINPSLK